MDDTVGDLRPIPRWKVVIVSLLMLVTGGIFFAKGTVEIIDRFAGRTVEDATLLNVAIGAAQTGRGRTITTYQVKGVTYDGDHFEFDDRRVYDLADGHVPVPVTVERSNVSGRVLAVRWELGTVDGVGGATGLRLAIVALVLGLGLWALPLTLPWRTEARKLARQRGVALPPPNRGALAAVMLAAAGVVGGTLWWDLIRH